MAGITRFRIIQESIEVPEGNIICGRCGGKALVSKYDEGVKTLVHDPELDLKRPCSKCLGVGYLPKG